MGSSRFLLAVIVELDDGSSVSLMSAPDGWGLVGEPSSPKAADLGPYGRIEPPSSPTGALSSLTGKICRVAMLIAPEAERPFGVRMDFGEGQRLIVYNWADELELRDGMTAELGEARVAWVCGE